MKNERGWKVKDKKKRRVGIERGGGEGEEKWGAERERNKEWEEGLGILQGNKMDEKDRWEQKHPSTLTLLHSPCLPLKSTSSYFLLIYSTVLGFTWLKVTMINKTTLIFTWLHFNLLNFTSLYIILFGLTALDLTHFLFPSLHLLLLTSLFTWHHFSWLLLI